MNFKFLGLRAGLLAAGLLASGLLAAPALANPAYTSQTGKPCGYCHTPGGEMQSSANSFDGLNAMGVSFKQNGHSFSAPQPQPQYPAQPQYQPQAPAPYPPGPHVSSNGKHTTENFIGLNKFINSCPNGQQRYMIIRPGKNEKDRNIAIVLPAGTYAITVLGKGTTYASQCGSAPTNEQQFYWVDLDEWSPAP